MLLEKLEGPSCPRCGCCDTEPLGATPRRRQCRHCSQLFTAAAATLYPVLRCPQCNGRDVKVTSTRKLIRYHKCACGHKFKTQES